MTEEEIEKARANLEKLSQQMETATTRLENAESSVQQYLEEIKNL